MAGPRSTNIDDVARLAGVSASTVSRVMNGNPAVKPETIKRVMDAAERLDYVPSNTARSLSLGSTRTVAFLMPDLSNPMFQLVLRGASRAAADAGYRILVSDTVEDVDAEAGLAIELRRRCDALILCSPRMSSRDLRRVLSVTEPVVLINRAEDAGGAPAVTVDYAEGSRALMRRLMRQGHRAFVYLSGPPHSRTNQQRELALRSLAREHDGVTLTTVPAGPTIEDGYAASGAVLASGATAAICYNDVIAIGLLGRLNEVGVTVPEDISVAGYDDIPFARYVTPSLTTVSTPKGDLGRHAWEAVERMLAGDTELGTLTFAPRLVERGSTGPAPRDRISVAPDAVPSVFAWHRDDDDLDVELTAGRDLLARYERRPAMPDVYAPRPYLHPLYTLAGRAITDANNAPHRHQHGVSVVFDSVNGTNYWGGRTYLTGSGPTLLPNHGTQASRSLSASGGDLEDRLQWRATDGTPQIEEDRAVTARLRGGGDGWELAWSSTLTPASGPLVLASPSDQGREDAHYGGLFWRFPGPDGVTVLTADGEGGATAHGSASPWLALVHPSAPWSVVLRPTGPAVRWHVRCSNYLAVCPSLVWDAPVRLAPGERLAFGLRATILDRAVDADEAAALGSDA